MQAVTRSLAIVCHLGLFRSQGDPILYLSNPKGIDDHIQGDTIATLKSAIKRRLGDGSLKADRSE